MTTSLEPADSFGFYVKGATLDLPDDLSEERWAAMGPTLLDVTAQAMWFAGDWWLWGERHLGERAAQAVPGNYAVATLQQAARVAEQFPPSRRLQQLSWGHHHEVAALPPAEGDQLLAKAAEENLSTRDLRAEVRSLKPPAGHNANPEYLATFDAACVSLRRAVKAKNQSDVPAAIIQVQEALKAFPAPQDANGERQVTPIPKKGAGK